MILGEDEEEILSEKLGDGEFRGRNFKNMVVYLTDRRLVVEGEEGGGLMSDATTATVIDTGLQNIRNVTANSGGLLSKEKVVLELDLEDANGFPKLPIPNVDAEKWKREVEQAVSKVT